MIYNFFLKTEWNCLKVQHRKKVPKWKFKKKPTEWMKQVDKLKDGWTEGQMYDQEEYFSLN